jgi:hypothetical protein
MNLELKTAWIEALTSGDYKQGFTDALRTRSDEYTCIGVLLDVVAKRGLGYWRIVDRGRTGVQWAFTAKRAPAGGSMNFVPDELVGELGVGWDGTWLGLTAATGLGSGLLSLSSDWIPFAEIAGYIEDTLTPGKPNAIPDACIDVVCGAKECGMTVRKYCKFMQVAKRNIHGVVS